MNKTININLGGYAFTIDEDAYETANRYLNTLTHHFSHSEGATEIMQDIETRMGELVNRTKGTRTIVSRADVLEAIAVLGTPEELQDIDFSATQSQAKDKKSSGSSFQLKTGKRLYRDPDDKILGGVCSGLASYFGIQDTVWIRIAFVLLAAAGGSSFIIYAVLWMIVPEARTVSDRLEMMGEATNVNNIARMVKEQFEEIGDKLHDTFSKKHKKYRARKKSSGDDADEMMTSGWTWDKRAPKADKVTATYNKKDFV